MSVLTSHRHRTAGARRIQGARLLAAAWLPIMFATNHRLFFGESATGANLLNAMIEVLLYGWTCVAMLADRRHARLDPRPTPVYIGLYLLPIWAMASMAWGQPSAASFIRSLEIGVMAALTNVTAVRAQRTKGLLVEMLGYIVRWFTVVVIALTCAGFVVGPLWARLGPNDGRFTWPAAHPGVSGLFLCAVVPILVLVPRRVLRLPLAARAVSLVMTSLALYLNHSRTSVLAALLAVVAGIWLMGRAVPSMRVFAPPYALGGAAIVLAYAYRDVLDYASRGQPTQQLLTLNNRTRVWAELPEKLGHAPRWFVGLGIGSTKTAFVSDFAWAGNAHNSAVALILSMGFIGLGIGIVYLVIALIGVWITLLRDDPAIGATMLIVLLTLVVQAVTSDVFAQPNFGMAWVYLCMATWLAERRVAPPRAAVGSA